MSSNAERMARIERRYAAVSAERAERRIFDHGLKACWSCRYREADYAPTSGLCDCTHPLRRERRTVDERGHQGNCGPDSLLYRHPTFNPAKWIRYLCGQRPRSRSALTDRRESA